MKALSNIFYELTTLTCDVICSKLYRDGENKLAPFYKLLNFISD